MKKEIALLIVGIVVILVASWPWTMLGFVPIGLALAMQEKRHRRQEEAAIARSPLYAHRRNGNVEPKTHHVDEPDFDWPTWPPNR
jgi:membrane protein implicated in regulation of membrane protease activity